MTRSSLLPLLVSSRNMEEEIISRIANMYNTIYKGANFKMLNLLQQSVNFRHMGIMGSNIMAISQRWRCGFEQLFNNNVMSCDSETKSRARSIIEMTECLENRRTITDCDHEEILLMCNLIATY